MFTFKCHSFPLICHIASIVLNAEDVSYPKYGNNAEVTHEGISRKTLEPGVSKKKEKRTFGFVCALRWLIGNACS